MILNPNDAHTLLMVLSAVIIPFVIAWLPTLRVSDYVKFGILVLLSLIGGGLTAYLAGQLSNESSIIQNAAVIATAAQGFYYIAFRKLGLEHVLFPQQAVINHAKAQVKDQLANISEGEARDVLNANTNTKITVEASVQS